MSHILTISDLSKAPGPVVNKFLIQHPGPAGTEYCSNGLGQITNMVTMSIYGKNLQKSFSRTDWQMALSFGMRRSNFFKRKMPEHKSSLKVLKI